jgi:hypothetical protein
MRNAKRHHGRPAGHPQSQVRRFDPRVFGHSREIGRALERENSENFRAHHLRWCEWRGPDSFRSLGKKRQFDGALKETEQRFFLLFGAADLLDLMAAKATKFQEFPASAAKAVDASVAHDLAAKQALVGNLGLGMTGANEWTVGENDRRGGPLDIKLGNSDFEVGVLDEKLDVADAKGLSGDQRSLANGFAADERVVGGVAISDEELAIGEHQLTVKRRNGGVLDLEVIVRAAPDPIDPEPKLNDLVLKSICSYD